MSTTAAGAPSGAPVRAPEGRRSARRRSLRRADARFGLTLISPTVVIVVVLVVLPIVWTVSLAFQDIRLIRLRNASLIGDYTLENFVEVFTSDGFWSSLLTTLVYSVGGTAGAIGLGLVAALALRTSFRGRTLVRASLLIPYVAPVVAAAFVWTTMLNPQFGIINHWGTRWLGWDEPIGFVSERPTALLTVIAFEMWRSFPFAFLFLTARLEAVPATLEEAAKVDGATPTQRFRHIILPQLLPTIAVLTLLRFIWTFNNFDDIFLLTGGAAGTEVVTIRVYDYLVSRGDIGASSAQALVLAAVLTVLVLVYFRFAAKEEAT